MLLMVRMGLLSCTYAMHFPFGRRDVIGAGFTGNGGVLNAAFFVCDCTSLFCCAARNHIFVFLDGFYAPYELHQFLIFRLGVFISHPLIFLSTLPFHYMRATRMND
ncbi:hypothetical protein BJ165DRAFT_559731 [Panaeolus papilionaceus]|nr:hypothetical protein BJ165DRAFT_559731 [Panaeolus papilionaceus]